MKKAGSLFRGQLDKEKHEVGFADLVEGTLTEDQLEAVLIEKDLARHPPVADNPAGLDSVANNIGIQHQLDLHGMTASEAQRRTEYFLQNCRHQGLQQVRIVTGKGLHSTGEAVLPAAVEQTLLVLKSQGEIYSFQWEKGGRRRSGALLVRLLAP